MLWESRVLRGKEGGYGREVLKGGKEGGGDAGEGAQKTTTDSLRAFLKLGADTKEL